jgi:hypothetical protein
MILPAPAVRNVAPKTNQNQPKQKASINGQGQASIDKAPGLKLLARINKPGQQIIPAKNNQLA